jgi:tRNA nucleotidyltransferase (CCA-adding enzyme)
MRKTHKNDNVAGLLRQRLPGYAYRLVRRIGALAGDNGMPAYIVGGFVRDMLLGVKNLDMDIVVEGDALKLLKLLQKEMDLTQIAHRRFGTASATFSKGLKIDFASARREEYIYAAALPQITYSCMAEDLRRRDFTINSLAVNINREDFGRLLDLFNGRQDLLKGKIRILHDGSFIDDPTRIFRAVRFEQRYGFRIERHSRQLIRQAVKQGVLSNLSRFRLGREIVLLLKEDRPLGGIKRIYDLCGFRNMPLSIRLNRRIIKQFSLAEAAIVSLRKRGFEQHLDNWMVYFMILTQNINPAGIKSLAQGFSLPRQDIRRMESFRKNALPAAKKIDKKGPMHAHRIYQILHLLSYEELVALLGMSESRRMRRRINFFLRNLRQVRLKIKGRDLRKLKLSPGPKYSSVLEKVLYARLNGKVKSKGDELKFARTLIKA